MKASELIDRLQSLLAEHGDLEVRTGTYDEPVELVYLMREDLAYAGRPHIQIDART